MTRWLSTADSTTFTPQVPSAITHAIAEGIQDTTLYYLRHGVANQRLVALSEDKQTPVAMKWQRMMEIYLSTQVFVISGLGYPGTEKGLETYTMHLAQFMQKKCDDDDKEMFRKVGNETWRELLSVAFELDTANLKSLSIVDARNIMHKVSSKMQESAILMKIQKECGNVPESKSCFLSLNPLNHGLHQHLSLYQDLDIQVELMHKHMVLQTVIVNDVYMGGSPSLVEVRISEKGSKFFLCGIFHLHSRTYSFCFKDCGFGPGEKGYAHLQCVMAEFETDPLIGQYAGAAMARLWDAAGLNQSTIQSSGNIRLPGGPSTS